MYAQWVWMLIASVDAWSLFENWWPLDSLDVAAVFPLAQRSWRPITSNARKPETTVFTRFVPMLFLYQSANCVPQIIPLADLQVSVLLDRCVEKRVSSSFGGVFSLVSSLLAHAHRLGCSVFWNSKHVFIVYPPREMPSFIKAKRSLPVDRYYVMWSSPSF